MKQQHIQDVFPERVAAAGQRRNEAINEANSLIPEGYTIVKPPTVISLADIIPAKPGHHSNDTVDPEDILFDVQSNQSNDTIAPIEDRNIVKPTLEDIINPQ